MSDLAIRDARPFEADALPALERSAGTLFAQAPGLAWIAQHEVTPADFYEPLIARGLVWVGQAEDGALAGFVSAEPFGPELHIWELAVAVPFQRRGLGRRLVRRAIDQARALRLPAVTLCTFRDVPWNAPFYESLGFSIIGGHDLNHRLDELLRGEVIRGLPGERRCAMRLLTAQ